jgi:hypothetical protein
VIDGRPGREMTCEPGEVMRRERHV